MNRHMMFSLEAVSTNDSHWGNCSFLMKAKTRVYQNINLHLYSLLIDTNNARFSFFAYASCDQSYFEINMYRSDGILTGLRTYPSKKKSFLFKFNRRSIFRTHGRNQFE
jgi:hypothetical protein